MASKSFAARLAALEALEGAQPGPTPDELAIDALESIELLAMAAEAIQDGYIAAASPGVYRAGPWYGYMPYEERPKWERLCDRLQGVCFFPLFADQVDELRAGLQSGDWQIHSAPDPSYILSRVMRRPNGEAWSTQSGGQLAWFGRALAAYAVQRGEPLTTTHVLAWLDEWKP